MNEIEIQLGKEAIEWIRQTLNEGNTLAKYFLSSLDLTAGTAITFLPAEANIEKAKKQFNESIMPLAPKSEWVWLAETPDGKHPVAIPVHKTNTPQIEIIRKFLKADSERLCIFEDITMEPMDKRFSKSKDTLWTFGKETYHVVLSNEKPSINEIGHVISNSASAWQHFIGAMTSSSELTGSRPFRKELTESELKSLAENTTQLIIGAYDNDGYLIWSKR